MGESKKQFEDFRVKGCVCAPFTLLKDDGEINFDGFEAYAKYLVSQKFTYLFVNGTLAEGLSLTLEERKQTAEAWVKVAKGRFGIILHIGTNNYKDSQELARHAEKIGVDAIACFAPSFYKPDSLETLVEYISKVASAAPNTPFFYYCINFFTGVYLNDAKFLELAESKIPNLVGLKHSSRELPNAHRCMMVNPKKFQVMIGSDVQLLTSLSLGIEVPVIASFLGQLFDNMKTAFDKVDMKTASKYQCQAQEINTIRSEFVNGTLEEGLSMTQEERKQTAETWVKVAKGRFGIILHFGTNNYKDFQETLVEYMSKVASAAPNTPFFYYCINFFTGVCPTSLSLGIEVPVIASFMGQLFDNMKTAFDKVDMKTASKYQFQVQELNTIRSDIGAAIPGTGINVAKAIFNIVSGLNAGRVRLPLSNLSQELKEQLKEKLNATGIFK
ncbi:N-acetylneuraminate lyase [Mytilus galloprovincialis]|uniref:N-acetylneuraminate lyase n=1 Tax=Mytilus galloprovincialis TaxID=29158 RepID=A0A8B6BUF0_MYTGA|nr:N-acetylneuraminate lyase [Mytilus galloprovincialis]